MFVLLVLFAVVMELGGLAYLGILATGVLLIHQHRLVSPTDLSRLDAAFFTTNAFVSIILLLTMGTEIVFFHR
jgi:4-hydroxybenzoate polyprenyltransferase